MAADRYIADPWGSLERVVARHEALILPPLPDETRFHGYYSLSTEQFSAGIEAARAVLLEENRCWSGQEAFLDVGSGIGTKLALADARGWKVTGLERHRPYLEVSERLWPNLPVVECDAFDFDGYDQFDLVYSYRLCIDDDDQAHLDAVLIEAARPGAFLFLPGSHPDGLVPVARDVWRVP